MAVKVNSDLHFWSEWNKSHWTKNHKSNEKKTQSIILIESTLMDDGEIK